MKVRYIGESFGVDGLTDGKEYVVLEVDDFTGAFRLIDDSGYEEGYLYSPVAPKPCTPGKARGRFEIVEDDENGTLRKAIYGE